MGYTMKSLKIFSIIAILIVGCISTPPEPSFFPIAEGNTWKMEVNYYNDGKIDSTKIDTYTICLENVYQEVVNDNNENIGIEYYVSEEPDEFGRLFFQNLSGIYDLGFFFYDSLVYHDPVLTYKYPVNVGDTWSVRRYTPKKIAPWLTDRGLVEYSCVAVYETYITPNNTFTTTVYYYLTKFGINGYHQHTFEYFSHGIGKVGMEIYLSNDTTYAYNQRGSSDLHSSLKLVEFDLNY